MTHRGPFQPLLFCDSVTGVVIRSEGLFAELWDATASAMPAELD